MSMEKSAQYVGVNTGRILNYVESNLLRRHGRPQPSQKEECNEGILSSIDSIDKMLGKFEPFRPDAKTINAVDLMVFRLERLIDPNLKDTDSFLARFSRRLREPWPFPSTDEELANSLETTLMLLKVDRQLQELGPIKLDSETKPAVEKVLARLNSWKNQPHGRNGLAAH